MLFRAISILPPRYQDTTIAVALAARRALLANLQTIEHELAEGSVVVFAASTRMGS
jgi:hypothetical protein